MLASTLRMMARSNFERSLKLAEAQRSICWSSDNGSLVVAVKSTSISIWGCVLDMTHLPLGEMSYQQWLLLLPRASHRARKSAQPATTTKTIRTPTVRTASACCHTLLTALSRSMFHPFASEILDLLS